MSKNTETLQEQANTLIEQLGSVTQQMGEALTSSDIAVHGDNPFIAGLTVFILAWFIGYHVVWSVTPALHSPLMGITNAISSVIIVGAVLATGTYAATSMSNILGFLAVVFASVNIFGGFIITQRMLHMFKKK